MYTLSLFYRDKKSYIRKTLNSNIFAPKIENTRYKMTTVENNWKLRNIIHVRK